ncbi:hypothetical protein 8S6_12 [uncultured Caudovirales phage]|jgi:hypothetical protein|uniref:Uncharacterized protein n=1 Tax=uncultured Caudovirales phage TaxID=2100421 RepID=A0A2H4JF76_9CAUD|nr:hypothetical protein 8S6_12 [uncultured Caudovirales phage]
MNIHSMPHDATVKHKALPKSCLLKVTFLPWRYQACRSFMRSRGANHLSIWAWRFHVVIRRPWMAGPARQLHPELFEVKP